MQSQEYRSLGHCKWCNAEIFGTHSNKLQAHQRFCQCNPNRQKALNQIHDAGQKSAAKDVMLRRVQTKKANAEKTYKVYIFTCKKCGNQFKRRLKIKNFENGYKIPQYCSNSCANSHECTEEQAKKIGEGVKKEHEHICPRCGKHFLHPGTAVNTTLCYDCKNKQTKSQYPLNSVKVGEHLYQMEFNFQYPIQCLVCGKWFFQKRSEKTCSKECYSKLVSENSKRHYQKVVQTGSFKGWIPRSQESYPEKYWAQVLTNLGIKFERELRCIPGYLYSLDFVIQLKNGIKVDFEIDGKQHWYDERRLYDEKRNKIVRDNGFLVYRVDWNNVNSKRGRMKMRAKINQFVWWFNNVNV